MQTEPTHKKRPCTELDQLVEESEQKQQKISHYKQLTFSHNETLFLLKTLASLVPLSTFEWEDVQSIHSKQYPHQHRTVALLQDKFSALYREQNPNDDPNVPYEVQKAKEIQHKMIERTDIASADRVLQDIARNCFSACPVKSPPVRHTKDTEGQGSTKGIEHVNKPKVQGHKKSAVAENEDKSPCGTSDCSNDETELPPQLLRRGERVRGCETLLYSALILYILQERRRNEEERRRREDAFRQEIRREEEERRKEEIEREMRGDVVLRRREQARQDEEDRRHTQLLEMVMLLLLRRKLEESSSN